MADDLRRVGLVFTADGAVDFKKSLSEINNSVRENYSEFKLAQSQWDENTTTLEKLRAKQEYLTKNTEEYTEKVRLLELELRDMEEAEERNEDAISRKRIQLNNARTSANNYQRALNEVEGEIEDATSKIKQMTDKLKDFSEQASDLSDKTSGISSVAAGVLATATALVPATEEYRKIMASLEQSSQMAGYSAEQTEQTYKQLFGVLGDDQSAATTTANLQALGLSQEQLTELTDAAIGAWAKYGDSIPIDGLAEAVNETVKAGQVTGGFADVLNWGTSEGEMFGLTLKENIEFTELSSKELKKLTEKQKEEYEARKLQYETIEKYNQRVEEATTAEDKFNIALENCTTETERVDLIMKTLSEQGLTEAGKKWQENNELLVDGNNATADLQEATAELAEVIAPIVAELTQIVADLLGKFNDMPDSMQMVIGVALLLVAAISPVFTTISSVSTGMGGMINVASKLGDGLKVLWGVMSANPVATIGIAITGICVLLIELYDNCEWFRDGVDKIWDSIKNFAGKVAGTLKDMFDFKWELPKIKLPHFSATGKFSLNPLSVPKINVSWYANGGILTKPTIFGASGNNLLAGGEAGHEAVLPIELLKQYIREENSVNNIELIKMLKEVFSEISMFSENNIYIDGQKCASTLTEMVLKQMSGDLKSKKIAGGRV